MSAPLAPQPGPRDELDPVQPAPNYPGEILALKARIAELEAKVAALRGSLGYSICASADERLGEPNVLAEFIAKERDRLQAEVERLRKQSSERASRAVALSDAVHTARATLERIELHFGHSSSCYMIVRKGSVCDCGTHNHPVVRIVREALAAMSQSCSEGAGTDPVSAPDPTEHAALLRVAEAAEQVWSVKDGPLTDWIDAVIVVGDALADLRRAQNGGSDGP